MALPENERTDQNTDITENDDRPNIPGGVWLIVLGVIFLLINLNFLPQDFNWWAIFILLPAFGSLFAAWRAFTTTGRINATVRASLATALVTGTVGAMFLFNLGWATWWPLMLIVPGLAVTLNGLPDPRTEANSAAIAWRALQFWVGGTLMLLGGVFMLDLLDIITPRDLFFGLERWWALFVLLPGFGALFNALFVASRDDTETRWAATSLLGTAVVILLVGVGLLFGVTWNLLVPVALILIGVGVLLNSINNQSSRSEQMR